MLYTLYCPDGNEEDILQLCKQKIGSRLVKDAFVFTYERMRRYEGEWHLEDVKMFPHSIFLESEDGDRLLKELEPFRGKVTSMNHHEEQLLRELGGARHHMSMSRGIIQKGITRVTEGPLKGKEQMITKIDRHKRIAFLKNAGMKAGLEIVEKN